MQRSNSFLTQKQSSAFAMILAISLIVLISTIMVSSINLSSENSQRSIETYLHEQEYFIAKSATETALLMVSEHNRSSGCLEDIALKYPKESPIFDVNVHIMYLGLGCANDIAGVVNIESKGTMVVDVFVKPNANSQINTPVTFHRRTVQKL